MYRDSKWYPSRLVPCVVNFCPRFSLISVVCTNLNLSSMSTAGNPKKRPYSDVSPEKSALLLSKPLDVGGKCNKKCTSTKGESIQCDLCGMWAHTTCEGISREQFKAVKALSSLNNFVYYCQTHDCASRIKNITADWCQSHDASQINLSVRSDKEESYCRILQYPKSCL